jgi:hypothetical protein
MHNHSLKKAIIATLAMLLVILPATACVPEAPPPPPPPAPSAGTIEVEPTKIDYDRLEQNWPIMAARIGIPEEAVPAMSPAITILAMPMTFTGSGWPAGELVSIELILPEGMTVAGQETGEDSVGIAFATADDSGDFQAQVGPVAKLNWLLRVEWTEEMKPDMMSVDPLDPGVYTIKAVGLDPRTMATTTIELNLVPSK